MSKEPSKLDSMRAQAEAIARAPTALVNPQPGEELLHSLLHNLQVHQIQLKMQNEELRQAQVALEESRDRYVDLYDFAPIGYLTLTHEGTISEINLPGADMLGVLRKKLIDRRFSQFVAAKDRERWYVYFASVLKQEQRQHCELEFQRKDGSRFHAQLDSQRIKDGDAMHIALTDITERIQAEAVAHAALALAEGIVDTVREPLIVLDGALKIDSANRSFYQHFHTMPENTVGRQLDELGNRQWDIPKLRKLLGTTLTLNQSFEGFEMEHDFPSIGKRKMLLNARRITGKTGETQLILLAIEDVTDQR